MMKTKTTGAFLAGALALAACGDDSGGGGGAGGSGDTGGVTNATISTTDGPVAVTSTSVVTQAVTTQSVTAPASTTGPGPTSGGGEGGGGEGGSGQGGSGQGGSGQGGAGGAGGGGGAAPQEISVRFAAHVGGEAAACGTTYDLGAEDAEVELVDLRLYVHDLRLVDDAGEETPIALEQDGLWQVEDVALLDFEDGTEGCAAGNAQLRDVVVGTVPAGRYVGLRFQVGVPFELNHDDVTTSPSPLNVTSLFWSWGLGHIFFSAVTSATAGKGPANEHFVHVGSTGCTGDPALGEVVTCTRANRTSIELDLFDVAEDQVVLDLGPLLADSNLATELGCHSFPGTPACTAPFAALGINYESGEPAEGQTVFSVEPAP